MCLFDPRLAVAAYDHSLTADETGQKNHHRILKFFIIGWLVLPFVFTALVDKGVYTDK